MTEVPIKIEKDGKWIVTKCEVNQDRLVISPPAGIEITYKSVTDLEERKNILLIRTKSDAVYRIASVEKVLQVIKRMIIVNCGAYRLTAYFMSPAVRGGVLVTTANWEKGAIAVLKTGIWFVSKDKQISVPLSDVTGIELTTRDVQQKQVDVVKIDHMEENDVVTSFVLCPLSTLQTLYQFLKDATKEMDMKGDELDPVTAQVGMLIYSGMDTHAIENMLGIGHDAIEKIYDNLLRIGLVEIVLVRREVQLTPKGVRYITDAVKTPGS